LKTPDIVLASSPHPFAALAGARLASRHNAGFVLEIRDLWPQTLIDVGRVTASHPLIRLLVVLERWLYRRADAIVTLLPKASEHIAEKGGEPARVAWLPNGVDLTLTPPPGRRSATEPLVVMYAGAHGQANALHLLLDAALMLQNAGITNERIRFRLVGGGTEKDALRERARAEGLRNVVFEPSVPKNEIFRVLAEADAFVIPIPALALYRYGVSPNKLFDYLAAGRPIILASTIQDTPVSLAGAGLLVPPTGEAIARAATELLALSPGERHALGERGRAYVESNFDLAEIAQRLERIFDSVRRRGA
jgi:glycosyltransferase involved in cell wall biosynthesis